MKKLLLLLCLLQHIPLQANSTYDYSDNHQSLRYPLMEKQHYKENFEIPVDTKHYTGKGVTVGVMDSDFNSSNFYDALKYQYLSPERFQNYNDIEYSHSSYGNGSDHGFNVARVIADNERGIAKNASIVGTSFGVGTTGILSDPQKYRHLFQSRPDIKIYNQSFGQTMDITQYKKYIFNINGVYVENPYTEKQFQTFLHEKFGHYKEGVNKDILFIWAAGNIKPNGNHYTFFENPMIEAGLPYYMPELEKGWISVVGLNFTKNAPREYTAGILGGHLARAGVAARWTISADAVFHNGQYEMVGSSFAAPRVAGVAALIKEKYPWMGANEIRQTILTTAKRSQMYETSQDNSYDYNSYHNKNFVLKKIDLTLEEGTRRMGWGILDEEKAINGPAVFTRDLIDLTDPMYHRFQANISNPYTHSIFSNDITGDAGLEKKGLGKLSLTGNTSYQGDTLIQEGILAIHRNSESPIHIMPTGILQIFSNTTIQPKYSTEAIRNEGMVENFGKGAVINGNYVGTKNSKLIADLYSHLQINGRVFLEEGSELIPYSREYIGLTPSSNTILSSTEPITFLKNTKTNSASRRLGRFSSKYRTSVLLKSIFDVQENSIHLSMQRNTLPIVMLNEEESTKNVASNLENIFVAADHGKVSAETLSSLIGLQSLSTHEELNNHLNSLSGEIYASAQALTFQQSQTVNRNLSNRLSSIKYTPADQYKSNAWLSYFASHGELRQKGYDSAKTILQGGQFGIDRIFSEKYILGTAIDYSYSKANFQRYAGRSNSKSVGLSFYGKILLASDFYTQARVGINKISTRVEREVLHKKSDIYHKDTMYSSYLEFGKDFHFHHFQFSPFLGYFYDILERGNFDETVDSLAIRAKKKQYHRSGILAGLRGEYSVLHKNGKKTCLSLYSSIEKNIQNSSLAFDAKYHGEAKQNAHFRGIQLPKYTIWNGLGIEQDINNQSSVYLNYDMKIEKDKVADQVATIGFKYKF
ncbi:MAG TPA: autotransporter domain-containing protein [Fusobacterium sp.]|uniref:S8 family serine peptidase n=1 Tax=Fusobacterium sp. TaxID=68766 RepID=UPI002F411508